MAMIIEELKKIIRNHAALILERLQKNEKILYEITAGKRDPAGLKCVRGRFEGLKGWAGQLSTVRKEAESGNFSPAIFYLTEWFHGKASMTESSLVTNDRGKLAEHYREIAEDLREAISYGELIRKIMALK